MTNYRWNGNSGAYLDPAQWTPAGVPLYGDDTTATILAGSATLSDAEPNGITLVLGRGLSEPSLRLDNAAFGPGMTLEVNSYASLVLEGYNTNYGAITIEIPGGGGSAKLFVSSTGSGQLNQYGTVTVASLAGLEFGGILNNNGVIDLAGGFFNFDTGSLIGTGTIEFLVPASTMNALAPVGPGQTLALKQGSLNVYDYGTFQGTIADFTSSAASVTFNRLSFDAATYAQDSTGEHLVLTNGGAVVGQVRLADTPATQYTVTQGFGATTIRPSQIYGDGSIPASIVQGTVTISNAEPNGQVVALGGPPAVSGQGGPNLVLDNAALGPSLLLTVASPAATGPQAATITIRGYDTNYGEIDVIPSADAQVLGNGNQLTINIGAGSQLNQEGTIKVISPQTVSGSAASIAFAGLGTLNNDGLIYLGPGSAASFNAGVTGVGTIAVDGGTAYLSALASTQTIDFLGGTLNALPGLAATIKDWNSRGVIDFAGSPTGPAIDSLIFNQTSASGGDLQLFSHASQVGSLHLLGTYATTDFKLVPQAYDSVGITIGASSPGV